MGSLHYSSGPRRHAAATDAVVQRIRAVRDEEWDKLEAIYEVLDHFDDVLSYSSSIPPRLQREFFELYARAEDAYWAIHDSGEVQDEESIGSLEAMVTSLCEMMNSAKQQAAFDRAALTRGIDRPPSKLSRYMPDNAKSKAMEKAEDLNLNLNALTNFERNLATLKLNPKAIYYVMGKSAMGQGDTAFVVRTVTMLNRLGLSAFGVKYAKETHGGGTSFSGSLAFITPQRMKELARPGDFIIEGPLSDPVLPPIGSEMSALAVSTVFDTMEGFTEDKRSIHNLRLYEYGTLGYRGGQAVSNPGDKNNVIYHADRIHHGFMGMGHGEMGAFYNASDTRSIGSLDRVLHDYAAENMASAVLLELIAKYPDAEIYIGYANQRTSVAGWVTAVSAVAPQRAPFAIVVGIYGELRPPEETPVKGAQSTTYIRSKSDHHAEPGVRALTGEGGRCAVVIADGVPAPVMAALQARAMPLTLTTGNYSLSEAVENSHFPIYETLAFNASVETALQFQIANALNRLGLTGTAFGRAAIALSKSSPESIQKMTDEIAVILAHPYEIRLVMGVIRANTDIKENLIARLAALSMH
ncbi:hypothetical protein B1992_00050 [Pseudoxanthomonas broegbernensis]|uniref:Uncharacterized protein n=1 Tax=Pseudoxanthomonas broegbernensis TaxID=83619 RepID=A0A7V8GPU1_9GAMM|nr:hypothetical protein B1992_00050 [Pseudoxanthomonas broegbernensis]